MPRPPYWTKLRVLPTGCVEWTGSGRVNGYAKSNGKFLHRAEYERLIGPVPDGLVLDHLCRNRACVNVAHLEPVTNGENVRRGDHWARRKTHCPAGHALEGENLYLHAGRRGCKACRRSACRAYRERVK